MLSNVPFLLVGIWGLAVLRRAVPSIVPSMAPWHVGSYAALFVGLALTAFGSTYYHLAPDDARLVWDRLPMTIGFMGLLTAMLGERVSARAGRALLVPLLVLGALSVAIWAWTGDLRLYGVVQFGSLLVVLLLLAYPAWAPKRNARRRPFRDSRYVGWALAFYGLAKIVEALDAPIYAFGEIASGHTLKHVVAAAGLVPLIIMLRDRAVDRSRGEREPPVLREKE